MAELPDWQPLEELSTPADGGAANGRIVVVVASEGAVAGGWAEHAAVSLAKRWSAAGQKVMLVDGSLQQPGLHAVAGIRNEEGLSDATLFGASVSRVARQLDDGGYFMITAGTAVADSNEVVRSPRWHRLSSGFVEAGVTLAVFVRDGDGETAAFLGSASEIVVLASAGEVPPTAIRDLEPLVSVVTGPSPDGAVTPATTAGEDLPLSAASLQRTAVGGRSRMTLLILAVLVLIVVLLAVFGVIPIPGLTPTPAEGAGATGALIRGASITE